VVTEQRETIIGAEARLFRPDTAAGAIAGWRRPQACGLIGARTATSRSYSTWRRGH